MIALGGTVEARTLCGGEFLRPFHPVEGRQFGAFTAAKRDDCDRTRFQSA
jgi:hypothetical protein